MDWSHTFLKSFSATTENRLIEEMSVQRKSKTLGNEYNKIVEGFMNNQKVKG